MTGKRLTKTIVDELVPRNTDYVMWCNYLIDVQFGVIVDVEASRAVRQAEVGAARTMLERAEERFGLKPQRPDFSGG